MFGSQNNSSDASIQMRDDQSAAPQEAVVHTMAEDIARGSAAPAPNAPVAAPAPSAPASPAAPAAPSPFLAAAEPASAPAPSAPASPVAPQEVAPVLPSMSADEVKKQRAEQIAAGSTGRIVEKHAAAPVASATTSPEKKKDHGAMWVWIFFILLFLLIVLYIVWRSGVLKNDQSVAPAATAPVSQMDDMDAVDTMVPEEDPLEEEDLRAQLVIDETITVGPQMVAADVFARVTEIAGAKVATDTQPTIIGFEYNGAPMTFGLFGQKFLPQLSESLLISVDSPFYLFVVPEGAEQRTVLYTTSLDPDGTRDLLRGAESDLPLALAPMYLFGEVSQKDVVFEDTTFQDAIPVRYYNFVPDATRSVDYGLQYEHVFIGTSREATKTVMEYVFARTPKPKDQRTSMGSDVMEMEVDVDQVGGVPSAPGTGPDPAAAKNPFANSVGVTDSSEAVVESL